MSEPDAVTPPTGGAPRETPWDLVQRLKGEGASRARMLEAMRGLGLDEEEARVLVNSVAGALPAELPSAQLTAGTDLLSPSTFTLSDIGLSGPPTVVGLYWMGFGVALLIALALAVLLTEAGLAEVPESVGGRLVRVGLLAAFTALGWGAFRFFRGVRIRRRP